MRNNSLTYFNGYQCGRTNRHRWQERCREKYLYENSHRKYHRISVKYREYRWYHARISRTDSLHG